MKNTETKIFSTHKFNRKEIFTVSVTKNNAENLIAKLITIALVFGIERTEAAIKNTYCKNESNQIISIINSVMKNYFYAKN